MQTYNSFQKLKWMIHLHMVNLKYVDLVCLIDMIEIQWMVDCLPYIRDNIPSKLLKHDFGTNIENLSVEINLRKRKWFFNGSYNPRKSNILNYLNLVFNKYSKVYYNFIFMGDVNVTMGDKAMEDFSFLNILEILISKPTC